jgi:hypothetical protein
MWIATSSATLPSSVYRCTGCAYELEVASTQHIPPCPNCENGQYETVSGGDSAADPYPDR